MKLTIDIIKFVDTAILHQVNCRWTNIKSLNYTLKEIVDIINEYAEKNDINTYLRWCHVLPQLFFFYPTLSVNSGSFEEYVELFFKRWNEKGCAVVADSDKLNSTSCLIAITYKMFENVNGMPQREHFYRLSKKAFK